MRKVFSFSLYAIASVLFVLILAYFGVSTTMGASNSAPAVEGKSSIFEFDVQTIDGQDISLQQMKGSKAYLVVNVASQ